MPIAEFSLGEAMLTVLWVFVFVAWIMVLFTIISTLFNLFAMRRGVLIVGEGRGSLLSDLRQLPRLIVLFLASLLCLSRRSI